ncbi:MAG: uroporphyrinogen decarboxylase family protein [Eubacteriales bacterium]
MRESLRDLAKQYLEMVHSPRNEANRAYWARYENWNRDMQRITPKKTDHVPFVVVPDNSYYKQPLGFTLDQYYEDPLKNLEIQMKIMLYRFHNFHDNYYYTPELHLWFGVVTELSMFDTGVEFTPDREPWIARTRLEEPEDLDTLEYPDFYKSGLMPRIHEYYKIFQEELGDLLHVMFPEWVRGPFCFANHLRGIENCLVDMYTDPEFFHRMMRFITDSRIRWSDEREKFLGKKQDRCKLWNDEIDMPMLSPDNYTEFVFPYEKELSDKYGEVSYWHSCGKLDGYVEQFTKLTNLKMLHCSPWSSLDHMVDVLGDSVAIDLCLNPLSDVYEATEEQMRAKLEHIKELSARANIAVRADTFTLYGNDEASSVAKIQNWVKLAQEIL